ncbi:MAG: triose-phosphate isomerase [Nitrospirae bacterium]|nr:MAG: triose-phosphate isomerase [Nitrospirota bacterium]
MAQRQRLIVGNWKMHKTISEARDFVAHLAGLLPKSPHVEIVLAPPFTALSAVADAIKSLPIGLSAQDVHWEDHGAFTGEVSPLMIKDLGCRYVIVGHSERRRHFGETDAMVNKKVAAVLRHGLRPILCVGETGEQRANGQTERVLSGQLTDALAGVGKEQAADVVVAYEPVWAIGSGQPATAEQARDAHRHIRARATALWGQDAGARLPVLYGGSVTPDNIGAFLALREVDGALVGGACLDPTQFVKILAVAHTNP